MEWQLGRMVGQRDVCVFEVSFPLAFFRHVVPFFWRFSLGHAVSRSCFCAFLGVLFFFSVLRCVFHRFFALSPFYGGVEWAHLVSNILRCLLVNFGSLGLCFASVCADAQIKLRCCFASSTWKAQVNKARQHLIFCSALGCLTQFTLSP